MYRTIDTCFWTDKKVEKLNRDCKLLLFYLITNPHAHISGIYPIRWIYMMAEIGIDRASLDTLCHTLSEFRMALFDTDNEVVFVVNMLEYQGTSEKHYQSAARQLRSIHKSPLTKDFVKRYPIVKSWLKSYAIDTPSLRTEQNRTEQNREVRASDAETSSGDAKSVSISESGKNGPRTPAKLPTSRSFNRPEIPPSIVGQWGDVRAELQSVINPHTFNSFVAPISPISLEPPFRFWVPNAAFFQWWNEPKNMTTMRCVLNVDDDEPIEFAYPDSLSQNSGEN